jgi:DNA-binding XRE family transcriptional regulator
MPLCASYTCPKENILGTPAVSPEKFSNFGDLLKYLRKREELTQRDLAIQVGYSDTQISRLEKNQRVPDAETLMALFVPALHVDHEP